MNDERAGDPAEISAPAFFRAAVVGLLGAPCAFAASFVVVAVVERLLGYQAIALSRGIALLIALFALVAGLFAGASGAIELTARRRVPSIGRDAVAALLTWAVAYAGFLAALFQVFYVDGLQATRTFEGGMDFVGQLFRAPDFPGIVGALAIWTLPFAPLVVLRLRRVRLASQVAGVAASGAAAGLLFTGVFPLHAGPLGHGAGGIFAFAGALLPLLYRLADVVVARAYARWRGV